MRKSLLMTIAQAGHGSNHKIDSLNDAGTYAGREI